MGVSGGATGLSDGDGLSRGSGLNLGTGIVSDVSAEEGAPSTDALLLESGDYLLLENGDRLLLE